ncbi:MAG TPA: electron transfer flavoprotein subunit alpha/FixB family protein [Candidatus Syntrophoarchaeum butanivorans]|uniref:Electron transfer flavoprotein subunit alpha n=1 Tax=Candidatus Syntropharchaeum butanivorans TaxID=1839936 RepID=A0A1F2P6F9_9EURY|nr:MAG: electron transfer flavoprotein subunit alpha [Candidatus Syntrophoarchaeum butanivorans]HDM35940.1 electron transfer flavoprotein subunit alpha/FixB family protein [Candidatus Syntrophoarchaeum butanivorans]HEC56958.1 electron transfer flavoprotein subunit alpha/FixB family protein [Candidatus Syntrophoarchaeum butanivorans]
MSEIFVLAEHRNGELRDVTFEMLSGARNLADKMGATVTAVLLGSGVNEMAEKLKSYANKVLVVDDPKLENFNAEIYQKVLSKLIKDHKPVVTLIGHTAFGMDLAPALAVELGLPLATDCIDLDAVDGRLVVTRQIYSGKVNAKVALKGDQFIATVRSGAFSIEEGALNGEIVTESVTIEDVPYRRFLGYEEAEVGEVDITQADYIVSVGRAIKDQENIPLVQELADVLGGVLACSRPVVDKNWLPKDRQVGSSGKIVKPKLYLAIGISGAFQHVAGMKDSGLIVAINKDPKAPIFNVADYGIVDDLFKVVPVLKEKIKEIKG